MAETMAETTKDDVAVAGSATATPARVPAKTLKSQLLGGSLTLLAGSGLVGVTNLLYNVVTARLLGPTGFAHATAVYTLLMLLSCITLAFQVVCAKYVAKAESAEARAQVFASLHQRAWMAGLGIGLVLFLFKGPLTAYSELARSGADFAAGVGSSFLRSSGSSARIHSRDSRFRSAGDQFHAGRAGAIRRSICIDRSRTGGKRGGSRQCIGRVCQLFCRAAEPRLTSLRFKGVAISFREGLQAIVFFSGQTVINNFDIVLVKHFFPPVEAGMYAAVALVGRLVNMCAWSVVNTMFPVSAGAGGDEHEATRYCSLPCRWYF